MNVRQIRKRRGWNQEELAFRMQVSQSTISQLENGADSVTLRVLRRAADCLNVPVGSLFEETDSERSAMEAALIEAFRALPEQQQRGWLDLARAITAPPQSK